MEQTDIIENAIEDLENQGRFALEKNYMTKDQGQNVMGSPMQQQRLKMQKKISRYVKKKKISLKNICFL